MNLSPEVQIGLFFFIIIGFSAIIPAFWPTCVDDVKNALTKVSSLRERQEKLPDRFDRIEGRVDEYVKVSEHLSRKFREIEDRIKGLESIGDDLFPGVTLQALQNQIDQLKTSQSSILLAPSQPPENPSRIPQNSASSSKIEDREEEVDPEVQKVVIATDLMKKLRKNWSNASASDRDRVIELLDSYLESEVVF